MKKEFISKGTKFQLSESPDPKIKALYNYDLKYFDKDKNKWITFSHEKTLDGARKTIKEWFDYDISESCFNV